MAAAEAQDNVRVSTRIFTNSRGQKLFSRGFSPNAKPRAVIFLHHGYGEHQGRYDKVLQAFAAAGVAVFALDAHGHGKSEPLTPNDRALVQSYQHLVDDLCQYVEIVLAEDLQQEPLPPLFLMGHSMGGLVASLACLRTQARWAGLILHSPSIDVEWTTVLRAQAMVGGLLASVVPRARVVPAVRPEDLSVDPQVVAAYVSDPLNTVGPVRARTANELLKGFHELRRRSREVSLPLYCAHGACDRVTSVPAARAFVEAGVASSDKCFRLLPGAFHELLHGPEREECVAMILEWVGRHTQEAVGGDGGGAGQGGAAAPAARL